MNLFFLVSFCISSKRSTPTTQQLFCSFPNSLINISWYCSVLVSILCDGGKRSILSWWLFKYCRLRVMAPPLFSLVISSLGWNFHPFILIWNRYCLLCGMVVLLIVGHFMGLPLLSHPMIFYILYVWSRKWDPSHPIRSLTFFHNVESLTLWAYLLLNLLLNFLHKFYLSILFLDNILPYSNIHLFKDSRRSQSVSSVSNLLAFTCLGSASVLFIFLACHWNENRSRLFDNFDRAYFVKVMMAFSLLIGRRFALSHLRKTIN